MLSEQELRETFEGWMASSNYPEAAEIALRRTPNGDYYSQLTHAAFQGWLGAYRNLIATES